ncbi:amino acid ABC transporter substrate-binding protein, PAAT family [Acetitomaculum ruminis DSM 5522]|uniref:Amino acid ABC transporter substrate-binding protein, PAAT family n=1 Tax=Acetitomaculum ruminis DSM 5522 TaxID=1120918 RepID=A0A1I1ACX4_9FIRM|nr:transporter substrate-binding domain-containing protein [Acetitomaculum ruminis]SFB35839.1 amino acid ABC transporter substrate-binding protein, PAAT family [Acetitomaculum ruminis DSM 5522]
MKKLIACILIGVTAFSLAACGQSKSSDKAASDGKATAKIESMKDLNGKTIGVQTGTTGDLYVSDDPELADATVERYNKGYEAVQALVEGKIDAVVIDDQPAEVFVSQNEGLKILDEEYTNEEYAMCLAKNNSDLTKEINKALKELKDDGTLDNIIKYYIDNENDDVKKYEKQDVERDGELVMATNAEFPPYEYYSDDEAEIMGIDVDIAQAVADKLGKNLKIEDMAFDSIIAAVSTGKADFGAAGMTVTDERKESVDFTDTYCTARQVIIIKE